MTPCAATLVCSGLLGELGQLRSLGLAAPAQCRAGDHRHQPRLGIGSGADLADVRLEMLELEYL